MTTTKVSKENDPVESMRGILKNVKKTSVELQEELGEIWVEEATS